MSFDPIDLALLTAGFSTARRHVGDDLRSPSRVSITDSEYLIDAAMILRRLWVEYRDRWDSVWAYEVAEPLGYFIGDLVRCGYPHPVAAVVEERARELIDDALEGR